MWFLELLVICCFAGGAFAPNLGNGRWKILAGSIHIRRAGKATLVAIVCLLFMATIGFYIGAKAGGEFDLGGTWVVDRTPAVAFREVTFHTPLWLAALVGYRCNTSYGANCSDTILLTGIIFSQLVLIGTPVVAAVESALGDRR